MVPILTRRDHRHGQDRANNSLADGSGRMKHILVFLLITLFSDVQGKVVSFIENNNINKVGSSGTADGYRVLSPATGSGNLIISNEYVSNRQKDYTLARGAKARHQYSGSGIPEMPVKNDYVKGELCIEFWDIARGVIHIEKTGNKILTGIPAMDAVNERCAVTEMKRLVADLELPAKAIDYRLDLMYVLKMNEQLDMEEVAAEYRALPMVKCCHPNYVPYSANIPKTYPNDTYFDWAPNISQLPEAWTITTGSSSDTIGIIDKDQFNDNHPDLKDNYAGIAGGTDPLGTVSYHGTACAGAATGEVNNNEGISGAAGGWNATTGILWMPYRITSAADNVTAVSWMVTNGACVISQASVYTENPGILEDAFVNALENGVLSIAPAGNANCSAGPIWPGYFDCVVAVGGIDQFGRHWADGDGAGSCYGDWIDVTAPAGVQATCDQLGYLTSSVGTSFGSSRTAGVASLVVNHLGIRGEELRNVLTRTADESDYLNENLYSYGAHPYGLTGSGRVNAYEAVTACDRNVSVNWIAMSSELNPYVNCYKQYLDFDAADTTYGRHTHSLVPAVPVIPMAMVQNRGTTRESFTVTFTASGYIDDKLMTLDPGQGEIVFFAPYVPDNNPSQTFSVHTNLTGDQNRTNDTTTASFICSHIDTLQCDAGDYTAQFFDPWAAWAMSFIPERPCTLTALQTCISDIGMVGDACTLMVWSNDNGTPGSRLWSRAIPQSQTVGGWNTFTGFSVPLDEPVFIGLKASGGTTIPYCQVCADVRWNSGRFWFSASGGKNNATDWGLVGFDVLLRPVVHYVTPSANDVGTISVVKPSDVVVSGIGVIPHAIVKNYGTATASFNVICMIDSLGTTIYNQTSSVTNLSGQASTDVSWSTWVPNWIDGTYKAKIFTDLLSDEYRGNDTIGFEVIAKRIVELDAGEGVPVNVAQQNGYYAVQFEPAASCSVLSGHFLIARVLADTAATCSLFIWEDNNGKPGTIVRGPIPFSGSPYAPQWCTVDVLLTPYLTAQKFWLGCFIPGVAGMGLGKVLYRDHTENVGRSWYSAARAGPWGEGPSNWCIHATVSYMPYNNDIVMQSIDAPSEYCKPHIAVLPKATIANAGRQDVFDIHVECTLDSLGIPVYTSERVVPYLAPGEAQQLSFAPFTPHGAKCEYIQQVTAVVLDDNPVNNTLTKKTWCSEFDIISYHDGNLSLYWFGDMSYAMQRFTPELPCSLVGAWIGLVAPFGWGNDCSTFVWKEATYNPPRNWPGKVLWKEQWTPMSGQPIALFRIIVPALYFDRGEDFYIGCWTPSVYNSGPYVRKDPCADYGRSWYDMNRDSLWWYPASGDWALEAIVKYLGGEHHILRGYVNTTLSLNDNNLHFKSYCAKNPDQILDETYGAITSLGNQGFWQLECKYFWPAWALGDRIFTTIDYETASGTAAHTGYYGAILDTLLLETNPQDAPACSLRPIPVPTWSTVYWWYDMRVVRFTWSTPTFDGGNPDTTYVAGYNVYRSTDGINFTYLRTLEGIEDTTFNDTVYPPFMTYYYAIKLLYTGTTFGKATTIESRYLSAHTVVDFIAIEENNTMPTAFSFNAYPNPFTHHAIIRYAVPKTGTVRIVLYDVAGRLVQTLVDEVVEAGTYSMTLNKRNLSSGIYFCRMTSSDFEETQKLIHTHTR